MVKGNKERRQELSQIRRAEKKAEKGRRKAGDVTRATPGEVRARLLGDAQRSDAGEGGLVGWVKEVEQIATKPDGRGARKVAGKRGNSRSDSGSPPEIKMICEHYFRTGFCEARKCRYEHSDILNVRGVPPPKSDTVEGMAPVQPLPLRRCDVGGKEVYEPAIRRSVKQPSPLCFVEWDGALVYDSEHPEIFAEYCRKQDAVSGKTTRRLQPWTIELHSRFPSAFQDAVVGTLLSAAWLASPKGAAAAATGRVAQPAALAAASAADAAALDADGGGDAGTGGSESSAGGGDAADGSGRPGGLSSAPASDGRSAGVAVAALGAADALDAGAPAASAARLPPELWHTVFGFLVRSDWPSDVAAAKAARKRTTSGGGGRRQRTTSGGGGGGGDVGNGDGDGGLAASGSPPGGKRGKGGQKYSLGKGRVARGGGTSGNR